MSGLVLVLKVETPLNQVDICGMVHPSVFADIVRNLQEFFYMQGARASLKSLKFTYLK